MENYPKSAQYALLTKNGKIQMFFRLELIQYSDGTKYNTLQYHSTCSNGWFNSLNRDKNKLIKTLIKL